jgi:nucleoside-diphosphate-sugar epimerase
VVEPKHPSEDWLFIKLDVTDPDSIDAALHHVRRCGVHQLASVVHLAAYYDFAGEPSDNYELVTVQGSRRLMHAVREIGCEQFIFSSTMLVHAPAEPGKRINEDSPLAGTWDYPQSKIDTERVLQEERGQVPVVFLRIAGVYSDQGDSIPIAQHIKRIYEKEFTSHVFPGNPASGQAFVHLDDVVEAIVLSIRKRHELPEVAPILIGEDEVASYQRLQEEIGCLVHGREWSTWEIPKTLAKAGAWVQDKMPGEQFIKLWMIELADAHYELDISRAHQWLGWRPQNKLIETLPSIIDSLKRDPEAWYRRHKLL